MSRGSMVNTGEVGVRGMFDTGSINHNLVVSGSAFQLNTRNAYFWIQKIHWTVIFIILFNLINLLL